MIIEKVQYHRYVVDEMIERFQARMFNRKASDPKNRPDRVLEVLKLQLGQRIADTGAGGGYFSLRFARAVGEEGRVYAVDTDPKFLKFIEEEMRKSGYRLREFHNFLPERWFTIYSVEHGQSSGK